MRDLTHVIATMFQGRWMRREQRPLSPPPQICCHGKEGRRSWAWVCVLPWEGAGEVASLSDQWKEGRTLATGVAGGGTRDDFGGGSTWKEGRPLRLPSTVAT